ncbi:MAG: hypothetical protein IPM29_27465 [Planctomycetes bacterium]|nr:hypothetical protein [Planctomycetota bacterium]
MSRTLTVAVALAAAPVSAQAVQTASLAAAPPALASPGDPPLLGAGRHTYRWVPGFAVREGGQDLGNTHGCIAVDAAGNVYFNTDTERAVMVYRPDGTLVKTWGAEFAGGLHGMTLRREGDQEYLYLAHIGRHEVVKTTLDGEVLWTLGYPTEAGIYQNAGEYRPTDVVVAPDGSLFVADGYGKSWVHQFDRDRHYVRSFGGMGTEPGQMRTPHGLLLDTRGSEPRLIVADRENGRLQIFDLDGGLRGIVSGIFRRPCNVYAHPNGRDLVVPDLAGRVTILDEKNELVCHLGDQPDAALRAQNGVPREKWQDGVFLSPHGAAFDSHGDLYVLDWNSRGRVSRLEWLPRFP